MGSLLQPSGAQPPSVYWRRRALVMVVALIVVAFVVWAVWPKGQPAAEPTPSAAVTASTAPASASPTPVSSPVSPSPSATPTPTAPQACASGVTRVGLAGFQKLKKGAPQTFKVALTNTGTVPCILSVSGSTFALTVTSGSDRIWSTDDCSSWVPAKKLSLRPQQSYAFDITWSATRSKKTCKTTKDPVAPGTYVAKATFPGATAARVVMVISA